MTEHAVYVPHSLGAVIGSRQAAPWLAENADQAITTPWRGQPVFAAAPDAYAWLDWARRQDWLPSGLAVAHVDARTVDGRIHIAAAQVRDAANQVLRPHPGTIGPDPHVLAACHGIARANAMRTWLLGTVGATDHERRHPALTDVWAYGYQLAARDGRATVAWHLAQAVRAVLDDPDAEANGNNSVAELHRLDLVAAMLAAGAALVTTADLPEPVCQRAGDTDRRHGWDAAVATTWTQALRTGALHGILGAAADVEALWRAEPGRRHTTRIQALPASHWLDTTLAAANRTIAGQWLLSTECPLPPPAPQPDAAAPPIAPAAGQAFPAASSTTPDHPDSVAPPPPQHQPHGRRR